MERGEAWGEGEDGNEEKRRREIEGSVGEHTIKRSSRVESSRVERVTEQIVREQVETRQLELLQKGKERKGKENSPHKKHTRQPR